MRVRAFVATLLGLSIAAADPRPATAQQQPQAGSPSAIPIDTKEAISSSVSQLVDQVRRHPPPPSKAAASGAGLYMIEINTGEVTLIAGEPDAGVSYCGSPAWSNDGKRIVFDANRPKEVQLSHFVSDNTIIAVVGPVSGDDIALIDVTDPAHAKVKETLLKTNFQGGALDVRPTYPVYLPETGRCIFIGMRNGKALYSFQRGKAENPKRLEPEGSDRLMRDLVLSPDGRYALFTSNRTGSRQRGSAPVRDPAKPKQ